MRLRPGLSGFALSALLLLGCTGVARAADAADYQEQGQASYYGKAWHGRRTASGAVFDMNALTAAHHWLPFGTRVRVRLEDTGEEVVVMITDRLRSARRVIDLSLGAAQALGMVQRGVAHVTVLSAE